ncbi:MAG: rod shape-determining protein MreD [Pseudomonadota bacterium]
MHANFLAVLVVLLSLTLGMLLELFSTPMLDAPWLLVLLVFWSLYLPSVAGIGLAWIVGLFLDAASATPLGSHALIFTLASALTLGARRLLLTYSVVQQGLWVAFIALSQQVALALVSPQEANAVSSFAQVALSSVLVWLALHTLLHRWLRARVSAD